MPPGLPRLLLWGNIQSHVVLCQSCRSSVPLTLRPISKNPKPHTPLTTRSSLLCTVLVNVYMNPCPSLWKTVVLKIAKKHGFEKLARAIIIVVIVVIMVVIRLLIITIITRIMTPSSTHFQAINVLIQIPKSQALTPKPRCPCHFPCSCPFDSPFMWDMAPCNYNHI